MHVASPISSPVASPPVSSPIASPADSEAERVAIFGLACSPSRRPVWPVPERRPAVWRCRGLLHRDACPPCPRLIVGPSGHAYMCRATHSLATSSVEAWMQAPSTWSSIGPRNSSTWSSNRAAAEFLRRAAYPYGSLCSSRLRLLPCTVAASRAGAAAAASTPVSLCTILSITAGHSAPSAPNSGVTLTWA